MGLLLQLTGSENMKQNIACYAVKTMGVRPPNIHINIRFQQVASKERTLRRTQGLPRIVPPRRYILQYSSVSVDSLLPINHDHPLSLASLSTCTPPPASTWDSPPLVNLSGNIRKILRDAQPVRRLRVRGHDAVCFEAQEAGAAQA